MTSADEPALAGTVLDLCGLAARTLGWRPRDFWDATPMELATALGLETAAPPLFDRAMLERLMEDENGRRIR